MDIRETERAWPANTNIRSVRVVAVHPKPNYKHDKPRIGIGDQSLARSVLGTAPVEADGSAYFTVPAGVEIYFQALDENGLAVQTMRSGTYVHPGERMTCIGCHEQRQSAPQSRRAGGAPQALVRAPSPLTPEVSGGAAPIEFAKLVQPVLDKHCVSCHEQNASGFAAKKRGAKNVPRLRGDVFVRYGWSEAYQVLTAGHAKPGSLAWAMCGGNGIQIAHNELSYSVPGKIGARASRLYSLLKAGHGTKNMTPEEMRRVTLWLDCNSVYYGDYSVSK
jgi:cytochrome c553